MITAFNKITSFHDEKTLADQEQKRMPLNLIEGIYKITANILFNGEVECFPSMIRNKARLFTLVTRIQSHTGSPSQSSKSRK